MECLREYFTRFCFWLADYDPNRPSVRKEHLSKEEFDSRLEKLFENIEISPPNEAEIRSAVLEKRAINYGPRW